MMIATSLNDPIEQLENTLEVIQMQIHKSAVIIKDTEAESMKYRYDIGLRVAIKNEEKHLDELQTKAGNYKAAIKVLKEASA